MFLYNYEKMSFLKEGLFFYILEFLMDLNVICDLCLNRIDFLFYKIGVIVLGKFFLIVYWICF